MPLYVLYTIEDRDGKQSSSEIKIPSNVLLANAAIFAAEMAKLIDPLIRGAIRRIGIGFLISMSGVTGIKTAALAGADVEEGARFGFRTADNFNTALRLATFDEAFVIDGTDNVDTEDADVAAFVTAMVSGINLAGAGGTGTVQATTDRGEDLTALNYALESFQSTRKAR